MNYIIVTDNQSLLDVCQQAQTASYVMLDTEFVRTRTYYPQLGLIQLYDGQQLVLIDPLTITDMQPFVDLLANLSVMKVLHACGEDLEVFQQAYGCIPQPMIDTQLMAAFLGHGLSTGFAALVSNYLSIDLDKSESRTDWLARPLTEKQLTYAAADVYYLLPLFQLLSEQLHQTGWWEAAQQESNLLIEKRLKITEPSKAYLDIKGAWMLDPQQLALLQQLAQWRLLEAQKRDLAVNFIVKEANLLEICRLKMTSVNAMYDAGFDPREIRRHGQKLSQMVQQALLLPESEWPQKIVRLVDDSRYKQVFKELKKEVKQIAETKQLASEFLASKKQLNQFISWVWQGQPSEMDMPDLMKTWRKNMIGERLYAKLSSL